MTDKKGLDFNHGNIKGTSYSLQGELISRTKKNLIPASIHVASPSIESRFS